MVKINTHVAAKGNSGLGGVGCVIWDQHWSWMSGVAQNLGISTIVVADLWGVYQGLSLPWERGFRDVIFVTDSQVAVTLLTKEVQCIGACR